MKKKIAATGKTKGTAGKSKSKSTSGNEKAAKAMQSGSEETTVTPGLKLDELARILSLDANAKIKLKK